jgi:hypothetical protein
VNFRISKLGAPSCLSTNHSISVLTARSTFWGLTVPLGFIDMGLGSIVCPALRESL